MPVRNDREYRKAQEFKASEGEYIVEGYASTFDPYVLWDDGETSVYEQIDSKAFDDTDMADVIMQYDHNGPVYARNKNGTLELSVDKHGLKVRADLSKTEKARSLYDDIKAGMVDQMSFAFTVAEDSYNKDTRTRTILKIKKLYDVSAVSIPANPGTEISARDYFQGVMEAEHLERMEAEKRANQIRRIKLKLEVE